MQIYCFKKKDADIYQEQKLLSSWKHHLFLSYRALNPSYPLSKEKKNFISTWLNQVVENSYPSNLWV